MDEESDSDVLVELFKESACTASCPSEGTQISEPEYSCRCREENMDQTIQKVSIGQEYDESIQTDYIASSRGITEINVEKTVVKKKAKLCNMVKPQPNFFFAIQIKHMQIRSQAVMIQSHITGKDGRLARAVIKPDSFHITLGVVHLKNEQEVNLAKDVLMRVLSDFSNDFLNKPLHLEFQGVATFRGQVVYAKLKDETSITERLKPIVEKLLIEIRNSGLLVTDKREWKPHLTLMKLSKNPKLLRKVKRINPSLFADFKDVDFGCEAVESIQLCSMSGPKDADTKDMDAKVAEFCFAERFVTSQPETSSIIQRRLNTLTEATNAIKRKIHTLVSVGEEKKVKVEEEMKLETESSRNHLKYVAAAGAIALGAFVAVKTLKRGS